MRIETYVDPDLGAIAVAIDERGRVVASASSGIEAGAYIAVDEAAFYQATGQLLPMQAWEAALLDEPDEDDG
jgi:hypothetical protein